MGRVGANIVLGTFWIGVAVWMFLSGGEQAEISAAILVLLGVMFYWAAFKLYQNPNLSNKTKKNLIRQMTDPNTKKTFTKKK